MEVTMKKQTILTGAAALALALFLTACGGQAPEVTPSPTGRAIPYTHPHPHPKELES